MLSLVGSEVNDQTARGFITASVRESVTLGTYLGGEGIHEKLICECHPKDLEFVHGWDNGVELVKGCKNDAVGSCRQDVKSQCASCDQHCNIQECAGNRRHEQEGLEQSEKSDIKRQLLQVANRGCIWF